MPSSFGTGLATGLLDGWSKQQAQQDDLKRQDKQNQIQNNLSIINARDVPDDVRQNAAQQLQDLMQGKKPGGKSQGGLSPVLKNLLHMVGKSHEADGGQGGQQNPVMPGAATGTASNDRSQPGQPQTATVAPGQGPSSRMPIPGLNQDAGGFERGPGVPQPSQLPTGPNGRPTLQGAGNAAGDPANLPQQGPTPPQSTRQTQIQNLQAALANTNNHYTKERLQKRIQDLQDDQAKADDQASVETQRSAERSELQRMKAEAALEKQQMEDRHRDEMAKARQEGITAVAAQKEKAAKELADYKEQEAEKLRAFNAKTPLQKSTGGSTGTSRSASGTAAPISDGGWRASALNEIMTGDKPSFGLGKSADRDQYNAARNRLMNELGPDGAAALRSQYKAGNTGLATLVKQRDTVGAFESTFEADLENARKAADAVPRSQAKVFTSWKQLAQAKLTDNPNLAKFKVATQTAINQYARLMYSATGGGTSTDTARREAEDLLDTAMAKGAYTGALDQMQLEVKNRTAGLDSEISRQIGTLTGGAKGAMGGTATPAQAKPPAVGTVEDGHRFKGGNPADPNNWQKVPQ